MYCQAGQYPWRRPPSGTLRDINPPHSTLQQQRSSPLGHVGASDGPKSVGASQVGDDETEVGQRLGKVAQVGPAVVPEETEGGVVEPGL